MPDVTPEVQTIQAPPEIRAYIAKMVGLDPEQAATIANERGKEAEVVRKCKENASKTYAELKAGQEVDSLGFGAGEISISPIDNTHDLLPNLKRRTQEINPPPPGELIEVWLDQYATSALTDKEFDVAVACYNYTTNENLGDAKNAQYIEKLATAATTSNEKYDLYLALQQVLPQEQTPQQAPQVPTVQETTQPQSASTTAAVSAASIEADEAAWRAAAGISPATNEPKTPITAPLQPDASLFSPAPQSEPQPQPEELASTTIPAVEALPPTVPAEAPPPAVTTPVNTNATEQTFPQPQPIKVPDIAEPNPLVTTPQAANNNVTNLRPAPTKDEAIAIGLIKDDAQRTPTTPSISSSEAELARAA